jgi:calcineurin-like phosphoesterase family protein
MEKNLTPEDFDAIEEKMKEIIAMNLDLTKEVISKQDALKMFADQPYKIELINDLPEDSEISVYHLGDFAFGSKEQVAEIVGQLNGRIRLIMGNHDHKKWKDYLAYGFDRVYDGPIIIDNWAIMSHHPHFVNMQMPYINIYGHVHDDYNYTDVAPTGACVCVERWEYKPVDLDQLLAKIQKLREGYKQYE